MTNTRTLHLCSFCNNTETEREKKVFRDIQLKKGSHQGARQTNVLGVLTHMASGVLQNVMLTFCAACGAFTGKRPRKRSLRGRLPSRERDGDYTRGVLAQRVRAV